MTNHRHKGFTLIEIVVAVAVIGLILGTATFGLEGARSQSRDEKRKADLAVIQSGLEGQFTDCGAYYSTDSLNELFPDSGHANAGSPLTGMGHFPPPCYESNTYIEKLPIDPQSPTRRYYYRTSTRWWDEGISQYRRTSYVLCAALENAPNPAMDTSRCDQPCGTVACNYVLHSP